MTFKKGEKSPNQGKRGPNKTTKQLKDIILGALDDAGGQEYLAACAKDPRTASAFLTLVGKVLPLQVTGPGGGALQITRIELVPLQPIGLLRNLDVIDAEPVERISADGSR